MIHGAEALASKYIAYKSEAKASSPALNSI